MSHRSALLVPVAICLLTSCATNQPAPQQSADFFFQRWMGRAPVTDQERADAESCRVAHQPTIEPKKDTAGEIAAAVGFVIAPLIALPIMLATSPPREPEPAWVEEWKTCLKARGYQLEDWQLTPEGQWVRR